MRRRTENWNKGSEQVCLIALLTICLLFSTTVIAKAQSELVLSINRDFGYGGFDNKIQGLFSLTASGPDNLTSVDFYIDEQLIGSVEESPFRLQFSTNRYKAGEHRLHATGHLSSGEEVQSNEIVRVFLTKNESINSAVGLVLPLMGFILIVMVAAAVIPALFGNKEKVGQYGILGGTVCPNCALPFSLKILGINWFGGKLQRCPHCGKWSVVRRASAEALTSAEARWRGEDQKSNSADSDQERTRRQIDDSRYEK
jgi:hypothetical protein